MAFAPSKGKKHKAEGGGGHMELNMTSLIDMFTCLLAFLLKSFSAEGALVTPSEGLELPKSIASERAKPGLTVEIGKNEIVVEGNKMANTDEFAKTDYQQLLKSPMHADLDQRHKAAVAMEQYGTKFEGEVIIQGDKDIPFSALYKVMFLCARNDYGKMRLIVISTASS
ncbi:MAG: biopolymer transporter ExbD [candidate division Zixibacteria bacterium]|nr:biopolymer transporter ExbD [candidate division Zixibacteria bacterium]